MGKTYTDAQLREFVHSVVVEQLPSTNSSLGVNQHGSTEKVKLLLNGSHIEPQVVRPQCSRGDDNMES
jgi:hypothetical protein